MYLFLFKIIFLTSMYVHKKCHFSSMEVVCHLIWVHMLGANNYLTSQLPFAGNCPASFPKSQVPKTHIPKGCWAENLWCEIEICTWKSLLLLMYLTNHWLSVLLQCQRERHVQLTANFNFRREMMWVNKKTICIAVFYFIRFQYENGSLHYTG